MDRLALVAVAMFAACEPDPSDTSDTSDTSDKPDDTDVEDVVDADNDGFSPPDDCDDNDANVFPGQIEHCDGVDEDCDGVVDDDATGGSVGFQDADGDGYGWAGSPMVSCDVGPNSGWSDNDSDCADDNATRYPGAIESCDGEDDNCDLVVDEGAYVDGIHFASIAHAVAYAQEGGVVTICSSLHVEGGPILIDRDLTVRSASGDPSQTEIDVAAVGSVFLVDGGDLVIEGFTIKGEVGTVVGSPLYASAGAVVNALTGAGGSVTVRSCVLEDNEAFFGGAIAGHTVVVTDSTLDLNVASMDGGAIWIDPGGSLVVERSSFFDNEADNGGGAIFASGDVSLVDVEGSWNSADYGGFAYVASASSEPPLVPETLDLVRSNIDHNDAAWGGAFYLLAASATADEDTELVENGAQYGGGVYLTSDGVPTSWSGGRAWLGAAGVYGGGFYVAPSGGAITLADVRIEENLAIDGGGGVYVLTDSAGASDPMFVMSDSTVAGNLIAYGGGAGIAARDTTFELSDDPEVVPDPVIRIERVIVKDSINFEADGGGLYLLETAAELRDSSFIGNETDQSGGGIYVARESYLTAVDLDFDLNTPDDVSLYGASYTFQAMNQTFTCDTRTSVCE